LAPLRAIGRYSYAIYLFHLPIIRYSALHYMPLLKWGQTRHAIFFVSSFAAAFVAAFLSWHLFEKHFLKLKSLFAYR
jgi:peptidoglycan/LPS O-acetylase OafA/YrhL